MKYFSIKGGKMFFFFFFAGVLWTYSDECRNFYMHQCQNVKQSAQECHLYKPVKHFASRVTGNTSGRSAKKISVAQRQEYTHIL